MIQLVSKELSEESKSTLNGLQNDIDTKIGFENKKNRAETLWNSKNSSILKKSCFDEVKTSLEKMCVSVEVCNYCEANEANDIEHIHPKSFFPNLTFQWTNYLLACKQCNTGYKLDKCYVMTNNQISSLNRGIEPPVGTTIAFINPRIEDPKKYIILDLLTFKYRIIPGITPLEYEKAEKTLEILKLNVRDSLLHSRKQAAIFYFERMDRLVEINKITSLERLKEKLTPYDDSVDDTLSLNDNKNKIKDGFKKDIQTHQHPSVWYSIVKIQSKVDDKWKNIFLNIPEALEW